MTLWTGSLSESHNWNGQNGHVELTCENVTELLDDIRKAAMRNDQSVTLEGNRMIFRWDDDERIALDYDVKLGRYAGPGVAGATRDVVELIERAEAAASEGDMGQAPVQPRRRRRR